MLRSFTIVIISSLTCILMGCAGFGIYPATADRVRESLRWQMLQHPEFPVGSNIKAGPYTLEMLNTTDSTVLVGLKTYRRAGSFFIEPGESSRHKIQNNCYETFFIFSSEPDIIHKGDLLCSGDQRRVVNIQKPTHKRINRKRIW